MDVNRFATNSRYKDLLRAGGDWWFESLVNISKNVTYIHAGFSGFISYFYSY